MQVGKQKEKVGQKVGIKRHICGSLTFLTVSNSRRFEVCGIL